MNNENLILLSVIINVSIDRITILIDQICIARDDPQKRMSF